MALNIPNIPNPYKDEDYRHVESGIAQGNYTTTQLLEIREKLRGLVQQYEQSLSDPWVPSQSGVEDEHTPPSGTKNPFQEYEVTGPTGSTSAYGFYNVDQVNRAISAVEASINGTDLEPTVPENLNTPGASSGSTTEATAVTEANQELISKVEGQVDSPSIPEGAQQTFTPVTANQDELATLKGKTIETAQQAVTPSATSQQVQQPTSAATSTITAAKAGEAEPIEASQGQVSSEALVDPQGAMGSLSSGAQVQYTQEELDTRATIQGQMSALFEGYEDGEIPKWAQPAVDLAQSQLSALGLSKSTIARDSLYNAIIGTALNIAQNDANAYKEAWLMNMDTKYKVGMFNAANLANMDLQNASFAQQAAIQNAQSFLQMDFKNMDNEQRTREINLQAEQQRLLSDQSAENAARQFNAESTNQMNQFMMQLKASIDLDNAARSDAISQFNAKNEIDVEKFNSQMQFQVDQFNAQMAQVIEQSNIEWRREINTTNTAGINAVNQANATNMFNLSNQALTFMWQSYRDDAYWAWMSSENDEERKAKIAMSAMTNETMADQNQWDAAVSIGSFIYNILNR